MNVVVQATDLELVGPRGTVYGPLSVSVTAGEVVSFTGPTGSGRTSLLLTLTGRMRPSAGSLTVLGHHVELGLSAMRERHGLLRRTGITGMTGIDDLDDSLTVREVVRERLALVTPFFTRLGRVDAERVRSVWTGVTEMADLAPGGEAPPPSAPVWSLTPGQRAVLQLRLALSGDPVLVAVDNLDLLPAADDRQPVEAAIAGAAQAGTTVLVAATRGVLGSTQTVPVRSVVPA
jgi:ABC-type multidrug transport system ATPase subunit